MTRIPAGGFVMGCELANDPDCEPFARPQHTVTLSAYWIDETEVSQASYGACVAAGACSPLQLGTCDPSHIAPAHPVVCTTWDQAAAFCAWRQTRLPTEAEWEKAARGSDGRIYPWGNTAPTCARANYVSCAFNATIESASDRAGIGPYGELDLAGNASEWVADYFAFDAYDPARPDYAVDDPKGPASGVERVIRGGNFMAGGSSLRGAARAYQDPSVDTNRIGFRCARAE